MLKLSANQKQHLIIFTRYPEPGKTKTRLIPILGEFGAAHLQRRMTEHTVLQVKELQKVFAISVEVRFTDGNLHLMQDWLGSGLTYQPQGRGDLGERMLRALLDGFLLGAEQVVIIGSDCPGINPQILATAFENLQVFDLVLGPALDGGYYLIGLGQYIPELFTNIRWGTAEVFSQTIDIAQRLNLSKIYLPALADIDRPEDLSIWESFQQ